jgi:hypothetical protein
MELELVNYKTHSKDSTNKTGIDKKIGDLNWHKRGFQQQASVFVFDNSFLPRPS